MAKDGKIRLINTKAHALYDYLSGLFLIFSPILFGYETHPLAQKILLAAALCLWLTALMSRFEYAVLPIISISLHYTIDVMIGAALMFSPWLFGFQEEIFKPHLVIGLSIICVSLLSDRLLVREMKLLISKGHKNKHAGVKKRSYAVVAPVLKLVVDPFYPQMIKEMRKETSGLSHKSRAKA